MALDLTISPLYRINGQEAPTMPGLIAQTAPRTAVRGRDQDRLVTYLLLTGNSVFTTSEYMKFAEDAAKVFYATSGSLTSALRIAAESVNKALLERNMESSRRGQYAIGWLAIGALRDMQITFLLSGPMHAYYFGQNEARHIFEPNVSGKGLGMSQNTAIHYAQATLHMGDRFLFCGKVPNTWETILKDPSPNSLYAMRRRLTSSTTEDLNAVLMQTSNGSGKMNLLSGTAELKEEKVEEVQAPPPLPASLPRRREHSPTLQEETIDPAAHVVQPSAYAIPREPETHKADPLSNLPRNTGPRNFPPSIPRVSSGTTQQIAVERESTPAPFVVEAPKSVEIQKSIIEEQKIAEAPIQREPSASARRAAKTLASGIQMTRKLSSSLGERLRNFLPRLLPNSEPQQAELSAPSNFAMIVISIVVPLVVVVMLMVVYLKYGRSLQYETYINQAQQNRDYAVQLTDPIEQRKAWESVLENVLQAEAHNITDQSSELRKEANTNLDTLLGITRLQFNPVFSSSVGVNISRMAASESDLFMLNAASGEVLRAQLTNGNGYQLDTSFNCRPGVYGEYTVGPLVDIIAMPTLTTINAKLLGIDASGNLLYCAPGEVPRAIPLPVPDTNWGRVTAFILDAGNLYVLDAPSRAVWVYAGKDGNFIDRPYFFFNEQTPTQDVIDMVVSGDELYMLHADGHLSNCSYNRIETNPQKCKDPFPLVNPFKAYQDQDLFGSAHFTQMLFAAPPDQSILILDADTQGVMRFTPRSLELQNQYRPTTGSINPIPAGPVDAVTVSPNHYLFVTLGGQVYFAQTP
ncbi:MAG: hypothetical protein JNM55_20420 [Anaerolineales bacterium]|nr:hypothetical protein [Anaerolineales bacterium]